MVVSQRQGSLDEELREDFGFILAATLTLLGLIIGFSFSMATSRYDQRKNYKEAEANAIGTEYVRADLLPDANAARVRALLREYLDERIRSTWLTMNRASADQCPNRAVADRVVVCCPCSCRGAADATLIGLAVSGMNDVLNSQGYTQAAYWNRIPTAAWGLMAAIAIGCNLLVGYGSRQRQSRIEVAADSAADCLHRIHAHSGHRLPAPRHYSCAATESDQPG